MLILCLLEVIILLLVIEVTKMLTVVDRIVLDMILIQNIYISDVYINSTSSNTKWTISGLGLTVNTMDVLTLMTTMSRQN